MDIIGNHQINIKKGVEEIIHFFLDCHSLLEVSDNIRSSCV